MRGFLIAALVVSMAVGASAAMIVNYGWEDGKTILGSFGNVGTAQNVSAGTDPAGNPVTPSGGTSMLFLQESPVDGTPQAYVAWVRGLNHGDQVSVELDSWYKGSGSFPRGRVWGHYTTSDITSYGGSASGPSTYADGALGWNVSSHTWTFDSNAGANNGLVIEYRLYSDAANYDFWVDDMTITSPWGSIVETPGGVVPEPGTMALIGFGGLAALLRRRR